MLDRNYLISILREISYDIVDTPLTAYKMHSLLSKQIRKYIPVKVVKKFDPAVEFTYVYVGGMYWGDNDREKKKCIEVIFVYNPFEKKVALTKNKFEKLCVTFADVVLHEIIHMRQYRRRKFKVLPDYASTAEKTEQRREQSYLGCTDEIDAYAFNTACELLERVGSQEAGIKYLGKKVNKGRLKSASYRMYLKAFDYNHDHPIIKRFKKKVTRYFPHAEMGKPYRNKDWIWH
jgi:hypothetical protein